MPKGPRKPENLIYEVVMNKGKMSTFWVYHLFKIYIPNLWIGGKEIFTHIDQYFR